MPVENGVSWNPLAPHERGQHVTFAAAVSAAFSELVTERSTFFDSLADLWPTLFPDCLARPGRFEDGRIFLYVRSASALYSMRPKLPNIRQALAKLPDAPKRIELRLEIHAK